MRSDNQTTAGGARRAATAVALLAFGIAAACATTAATRPPPATVLEGELRAQMDAEQATPWSASRALVWGDFKGAAPAAGPEGAETAYDLLYGVRCVRGAFAYRVTAAFLPQRSWVRPAVVADPDENRRTLRHEQTHFNLTEVHARRLRKYFFGLYNPCGQTDDQLRASAEPVVRDEASAQARYDMETRHGLDRPRQATWDRDVDQMLAALDAYR